MENWFLLSLSLTDSQYFKNFFFFFEISSDISKESFLFLFLFFKYIMINEAPNDQDTVMKTGIGKDFFFFTDLKCIPGFM